ncbi:cyclin-dependent kinase 7-like [Dreissena polymorpha]|uniref:cyclin-dependent kinase 7-like n=1 Tax=Dreissena polymorpha TaxID=45954 RepID=UPI002264C769|nr:cyclin-dependent kinase 7-like [Dreissena polymorpha]
MEDKSKLYEKIEFLGEGQFATVYKARDVVKDRIVAVKKIKLGTRQEAADGINRTALREIKLLQELNHPHIIGLLDVFGQKSNVSLVFDFMETDLEVIIKDNTIILTMAHIKAYILQTLQGLEYLHANWILHRDMKPNNLLINKDGVLKLGDFGLAKFFGSPNRIYTHQVVTRWYRCPELLFGARNYGTGVDTWAVGCILAELLLRVPFLAGETDLDQLSKIFEVLGTPSRDDWPAMEYLPDFVQFKPVIGRDLKEIFIAASDDLLELLRGLLRMDPLSRITASQALQKAYFQCKPYPTPYHLLPQLKNNKKEVMDLCRPSLKRKMESETGNGGLVKRLVF